MSRLAKHLYEHDSAYLNVKEDYVIDKSHNYTVDYYMFGRCHLAALALHEELGLEIGLFIDHQAIIDDMVTDVQALVHAYCYLDEEFIIDAQGGRTKTEQEDLYLPQAFDPDEIRGPEAKQLLLDWIKAGKLVDYEAGEQQALASFVRQMRKLEMHIHVDKRSVVIESSNDDPSP